MKTKARNLIQAVGKFSNIPVSLSTGLTNLLVPLYTLKSGSLEMPLSPSYHAGSLKADELVSLVGMNWALNARGVITRMVRGLPDENLKGFFNQMPMVQYDGAILTWFQKTQFADGKVDGKPGFFSFNFGNTSGQLVSLDANTIVNANYQDYAIRYTEDG